MSSTTLPDKVNELAPAIMQILVTKGDLAALSPTQKTEYYSWFCRHVGLDPATMPFQILKGKDGKEKLYADRSCCAQLNKLYHVSHVILSREMQGDIYIVTARAVLPTLRQEESIGAVNTKGKFGEDLANQMMRAETKSKRRSTLDLLGLGMLDEEEIEGLGSFVPATKPADLAATPAAQPPLHPPSAIAPADPQPAPTAPPPPPAPAPQPESAPAAPTEAAPTPPAAAATPGEPTAKEKECIRIREKLEERGIPERFAIKLLVDKGVTKVKAPKTIEDLEDGLIASLQDPKFLGRIQTRWNESGEGKAPPPAVQPPKDPAMDQEAGVRDYVKDNPFKHKPLGVPGGWKEVAVHFGGDNHLKIKDMNRQKFAFYYNKWVPREYQGRISEDDYRLDAALVEAGRSQE